MDASHLLPTAVQPHPHNLRDTSNEIERGSISVPGPHVESNADRSHDAHHSTAGWAPTRSVAGPRVMKRRKTLVLCFDGTGKS
jgi:hypothetical protein